MTRARRSDGREAGGQGGGDDPLELNLTRGKILKGAAEVFASTVPAEATIDDLVLASGVARRTFYRFFRNADEVLLALYEIACAKVIARINAAVAAEDDGWGKLRAGVMSFLDFHAEAGQLLRVLQGEAMRPGSALERRRSQQFDAIAAIFDAEIQVAQGRRVDPVVLRGLLLAVEGLSNHYLLLAGEGPIDRAHAERVILRIVGATLAIEGGPLPPMPLARA